MAKLAIAVIHGMGTQGTDFADGMISEIGERVEKNGKDPGQIAWKTIFWADVLDGRELAYFRRAKRSSDMDLLKLRKFVVTALGDAVGYQEVTSKHNTTYDDIHARVHAAIQDLYAHDLNGVDTPLIVMAHSLGCQIMSNYIWDVQKGRRQVQGSAFERMETLAGMVTFGCNIPLFTFAYGKVEPIAFPGAGLPPDVAKKARWFNYYDPDDILGYPLQSINSDYKKVVTKDIPINVGGFLSNWNPLSHSAYWTDNSFTKPAAKFIGSLL